MNQLFEKGQKINSPVGLEYEILDFLGSGGQGEVYLVKSENKQYALKWYFFKQASQEQKIALEKLVEIGSPNNCFLWPIELVYSKDNQGFGYIMGLRDKKYKSINDLMKRKIEPTFYHLISACYNLVDSFYELHSKGLCYRDISFGNVFFDPKNGEVLICDNDNVTVNNSNGFISVLGTPSFMAPEIVRGEAFPNRNTDLYSLSVLLFYLLFISHPLEGKRESNIHCMDTRAMNRLYGEDPVFIYDPNNLSNRPEPGIHENAIIFWRIYPKYLKDLFIRAFTKGLNDPNNGRVREIEWRDGLILLRDSIIYCNNCDAENFGDITNINNEKKCWQCQNSLEYPTILQFSSSNFIFLNSKSNIFQHHLDHSFKFDKVIGTMNKHPSKNLWGIKNESSRNWTVQKSDNTQVKIEPNQTVSLKNDLKIDFGEIWGEIKSQL